MKSYDELTLLDDYMFCKVMSNPDLCKGMLERLLSIQIDHIEKIQSQFPIAPDYEKHGIRLDVYLKDSSRIFDIEVQTTNQHNLEQRARYYQGIIDIDQLEHSESYNNLKESYVIFICTFDPFGKDLLSYTVTQRFEEDLQVEYNDKTHKVFYNLSASVLKKAEQSELIKFLNYFITQNTYDDFTNRVQAAITSAKYNLAWRKDYMMLDNLYRDAIAQGLKEGREQGFEEGREEGREQGLEEGRAEGREEGREEGIQQGQAIEKMKNAIIAVMKFHIPAQDVSKEYGISLEELNSALACC